jgi:hypothetical protein
MSERDLLTRHRGRATWGERLVPLGDFRDAALRAGIVLPEGAREAARASFVAPRVGGEGTPVEGPFERVVVCGGVYNNRFALESLLEEAAAFDADAIYCLGDLGGFGPSPEAVRPVIERGGVRIVQGNYEDSLASGREDCNCGYADPRDNHFADLSYRYTASNCSSAFKEWLGSHPKERRIRVGARELLLAHGSPRRINEFLFESTTPDSYLEVLCRQRTCDGILVTHTGLHWHRRLPSGRDVVNVGVLGRPANDGRREVWYARLSAVEREGAPALEVDLRPLAYDWQALAAEMRRERLPEEFVETIETGWWTTCLEVLPAKERARSRY